MAPKDAALEKTETRHRCGKNRETGTRKPKTRKEWSGKEKGGGEDKKGKLPKTVTGNKSKHRRRSVKTTRKLVCEKRFPIGSTFSSPSPFSTISTLQPIYSRSNIQFSFHTSTCLRVLELPKENGFSFLRAISDMKFTFSLYYKARWKKPLILIDNFLTFFFFLLRSGDPSIPFCFFFATEKILKFATAKVLLFVQVLACFFFIVNQ